MFLPMSCTSPFTVAMTIRASDRCPSCFAASRKGSSPLGGVGRGVDAHARPWLERVFGDLLVGGELAGFDDPHFRPGLDRVLQEAGVHGPPPPVVAAKGERDVAAPAADLDPGQA